MIIFNPQICVPESSIEVNCPFNTSDLYMYKYLFIFVCVCLSVCLSVSVYVCVCVCVCVFAYTSKPISIFSDISILDRFCLVCLIPECPNGVNYP